MSVETLESGPAAPSDAKRTKRPRRRSGGAFSIMAHAEPIVWLNGAGLVICMTMVLGLLLLVLYQGVTTFWPMPIVEVTTLNGETVMGEVTRSSTFDLGFSTLTSTSGEERKAAEALLYPIFRDKIQGMAEDDDLAEEFAALTPDIQKQLRRRVSLLTPVREAPPAIRKEFLATFDVKLVAAEESMPAKVAERVAPHLQGESAEGIQSVWEEAKQAEQTWSSLGDLEALSQALENDGNVIEPMWTNAVLRTVSYDVVVPMHRRLFRTGNYELTNEHFEWVSDFAMDGGDREPEWAVLLERLAWGRFYGTPQSITIDEQMIEGDPKKIWQKFEEHHPAVRNRWHARRKLETVDVGEINGEMEAARLDLRSVELEHGKESPEWQEANQKFQQQKAKLDDEFAEVREQINELDAINARYSLVMRTSTGADQEIMLADIVRAYPANRISLGEKTGVYFSRWGEFLLDDPREANSEGGVFPAIWGTVAMTMLMSIAVVPFGVMAALYLREYAKAGLLVSTVRIAVNNLAGVPSIVFGVFGLGFFCYIMGTTIDELFFSAKLPSPTFGTGGLMWASLTLALLTLPVVIVATEEALAAVPRSMREGSLACGASKWQTIQRIVLPRAMPGIMTGMILAMARGAGEVAPLMLVGAVKLAPELPLDSEFPFVHMQRSFMHLGFHIYDLGFQSQNSEAAKPMVFTTTLLLIFLIALMNLIAIWMRARLKRKFTVGQ